MSPKHSRRAANLLPPTFESAALGASVTSTEERTGRRKKPKPIGL
jgi:hypothetical protein